MTVPATIRQLLATDPANADVLAEGAVHAINGQDYGEAKVLAWRALGLSAQNYRALFCLVHGMRERRDVARKMQFSRMMVCLDPALDVSFYSLLSAYMVLAAVGELDRPGFDAFTRWVERSLAASGMQHYTSTAICGWLRDRVSAATLGQAHHVLGMFDNAKSVLPDPPGVKAAYFVAEDMVRFFGDGVYVLDLLHKLIELGHLPRRPIHIACDRDELANPAILQLWPGTVRKVSVAALNQLDRKLVVPLNTTYFPYGKRFFMKTPAYCLAQREWERKGRGASLTRSISPATEASYSALLARLGWNADDQVVCFHLREDVYHRQGHNSEMQRFRNTKPENYRSAILHLIGQGFRIIRMGANNTYPFGLSGSFFDYANSADKSPDLDLEIPRRCSFYFGSGSGPVSLAVAYGKPCCIVDNAEISSGLPSARTLYSFKLVLSLKTGRLLKVSDLLNPPLRFISEQRILDEHELKLIGNGADDIQMTLEEFLKRVRSGGFHDPQTFGVQQRRVLKIYKRNKIVTNGLPCEAFLEKYDYLVN